MTHLKFVYAADYFEAGGVPPTMELNRTRNLFRDMIQRWYQIGYIRVASVDIEVIKASKRIQKVVHVMYLNLSITGVTFKVMIKTSDLLIVNAFLSYSSSSIASGTVMRFFRDIYPAVETTE